MLEYAYYSVISPEGCAAILWKDGDKKADAAAALKLTAQDLRELSIVDEVVPEPLGGAHRDPAKTAIRLRDSVLHHLGQLGKLDPDTLIKLRYEKYRRLGST